MAETAMHSTTAAWPKQHSITPAHMTLMQLSYAVRFPA
jgi:hypothetical protein